MKVVEYGIQPVGIRTLAWCHHKSVVKGIRITLEILPFYSPLHQLQDLRSHLRNELMILS